MIIFEKSRVGRIAGGQAPALGAPIKSDIPEEALRTSRARLPELSELQVVRHFTQLSQTNFSIDTHFYPLGSCTMKYNPRGVQRAANLPGFSDRHPLIPSEHSQGFLQCLYELQTYLQTLTGMNRVCLTPMAGSQGEFAGVAMIKAYHDARGDTARQVIIIPDAAHGTNPASAVMCGYQVVEIPTLPGGDIDVDALRQVVGADTAGIMLTNPSTLGVFGRRILEVANIIHEIGGLLYYDGANLNAILGKVRPGDMGFDVIHLNLHKTFATPHGGGGPGAGPIGVAERLIPYLPTPMVTQAADNTYRWLTKADAPQSIGRLSAFMGNAAILLRAYAYIRLLGQQGVTRVSEFATLNANYVMVKLEQAGFTLAYPERRATHEFIITLAPEKKAYGVGAKDFAKRLLDHGIHAPTTYFPLIVPECLLIEPTETETKEELDHFIAAMIAIREEAIVDASVLQNAPHTLALSRLDEAQAARSLDLVWQPETEQTE